MFLQDRKAMQKALEPVPRPVLKEAADGGARRHADRVAGDGCAPGNLLCQTFTEEPFTTLNRFNM